jgi:hypothetical protein
VLAFSEANFETGKDLIHFSHFRPACHEPLGRDAAFHLLRIVAEVVSGVPRKKALAGRHFRAL